MTYRPAPVSPGAVPVPAIASRLEPDAIGRYAAAFLAWIAVRSLQAAPASQRLPVAGIIAAGAVLMLAARFGLRAAEGCVRRPAGVLDEEKQLRTAAAGGPAAPAGIAGAAKTRPVMLTNAGTVLAMTARFDPSTPNVAWVYNHWLGGKDASSADRAETNRKPGLCSRHLGLGCA